jgi:hypothetical protein
LAYFSIADFVTFFHAGNFINFIRLPKRSELEKDFVGERTVVSGWGLTKDSNYIIYFKTSSFKYKTAPKQKFYLLVAHSKCSSSFYGQNKHVSYF